MICLVEDIREKSFDFIKSLRFSGINCPVISCNDDGFLPYGIESPFAYFSGDREQIGYPKYFNQVKIPEFWEIQGDNNLASVIYRNQKKANIFFRQPTHDRYVRAVEWFDVKESVRQAELYDKNGRHFSTIVYDSQQQPLQRVYYDQNNEIVIVEHYSTGSIRLKYNGKWRMFENKAQFMTFYIEEKGYSTDRIIYNNLSTSFLVVYEYLRQHTQTQNDVLFWQEDLQEDIPGNMMAILENPVRQTTIAVENLKTYEKLKTLVSEKHHEKIVQLGYIFEYARLNNLSKNILILTNSDQIAKINELVNELPDVHFHIAAITEMSSRLMEMINYQNVSLYPNVSTEKVQELYQICDVYLDINYGDEIVDAVRTAFNHNIFIASFEEICHNLNFVAPQYCFTEHHVENLINLLKAILKYPELMESVLFIQKQHAGEDTVENYKKLFGGSRE